MQRSRGKLGSIMSFSKCIRPLSRELNFHVAAQMVAASGRVRVNPYTRFYVTAKR